MRRLPVLLALLIATLAANSLAWAPLGPTDPESSAAKPTPEELGFPSEGLDVLRLEDGRVIRCAVGNEADGKYPVTIAGTVLQVPKESVASVRYFRDFDSTPRDADEEKKVARGLVRWDGKWVAAKKAEQIRNAEVSKARKIREDDEKHELWEDRRIHETRNFRIEANISMADLEYYAELLEDFYSTFTRMFKIKLTQRAKKNKLPVLLFRQREEYWKHFEQDRGGEGEHTNGYFVPVPGKERLVMHARPGSRKETTRVLLHEGTHYILHLANPQVMLPRWIHEGCAEYFAGFKDGRFTPGKIQDHRLLNFQEMIKGGKVIDFDEILTAGNPSKHAERKQFSGPHYAQTWAFAHYMFHGKNGRYKAAFTNHLTKWITGRGVKYQAFTASERKYVLPEDDKEHLLRALKHNNFDKISAEVVAYAMQLPLEGAAAYVDRGEIRYHRDKQFDKAQEDFDAALERGAEDPEILLQVALAYGRMSTKGPKEAIPILQKALELDPLNVDARFHLARMSGKDTADQLRICAAIEPDNARVLRQLAWSIFTDDISNPFKAANKDDEAYAAEALALTERAVKNDPGHYNQDTLSALYLMTGRFDEALAMSVRAVQQEPDNETYLRRLAIAHAILGETSDFTKQMRRLEFAARRSTQGSTPSSRAGKAQINKATDRALAETYEYCTHWEKFDELAAAFNAWYTSREPRSEQEWIRLFNAVYQAGQKDRALEVATKATQAFPGSSQLKNAAKAMERSK